MVFTNDFMALVTHGLKKRGVGVEDGSLWGELNDGQGTVKGIQLEAEIGAVDGVVTNGLELHPDFFDVAVFLDRCRVHLKADDVSLGGGDVDMITVDQFAGIG